MLSIINCLNSTGKKIKPVQGFTFSTLNKLNTVKSTGNKLSLLDFITEKIQENKLSHFSKLSTNFHMEFKSIRLAKNSKFFFIKLRSNKN